jgi:hypothetical protein
VCSVSVDVHNKTNFALCYIQRCPLYQVWQSQKKEQGPMPMTVVTYESYVCDACGNRTDVFEGKPSSNWKFMILRVLDKDRKVLLVDSAPCAATLASLAYKEADSCL